MNMFRQLLYRNRRFRWFRLKDEDIRCIPGRNKGRDGVWAMEVSFALVNVERSFSAILIVVRKAVFHSSSK
ncbi:MAG: hypothetical protein V1926_05940 [Candidatus Peregrinibacteria bacterium]